MAVPEAGGVGSSEPADGKAGEGVGVGVGAGGYSLAVVAILELQNPESGILSSASRAFIR